MYSITQGRNLGPVKHAARITADLSVQIRVSAIKPDRCDAPSVNEISVLTSAGSLIRKIGTYTTARPLAWGLLQKGAEKSYKTES
jgi:hypothetical protein